MSKNIGYMQVHIKIYKNKILYDEFAFNACDGKFQTETDLIKSEFEIINDPSEKVEKVVTLLAKIIKDNYTIALMIPVHSSSEWEIIEISEVYIMTVFCILNDED